MALRATGRDTIIAFEGAFHGRTLGALSLTANPKYREPYIGCDEQEAADRFAHMKVLRLPFNDGDALAAAMDAHRGKIAGVFMEPIQGEGGIFPATREFLFRGARAVHRARRFVGHGRDPKRNRAHRKLGRVDDPGR